MEEEKHEEHPYWIMWLTTNPKALQSFVSHMRKSADMAYKSHRLSTSSAVKPDHERINGEIDALTKLTSLVTGYKTEEVQHELALEENKRGG